MSLSVGMGSPRPGIGRTRVISSSLTLGGAYLLLRDEEDQATTGDPDQVDEEDEDEEEQEVIQAREAVRVGEVV